MKNIFPILSLILLLSCSDAKIDLQEEEKKIIASWIDWEEKAKSGAPDFYWTEDAMILAQGQPMIKGKKEIQEMTAALQEFPGFKMTWDERPSSIEISKDGQMAYLLAKNEISMADSTGAIIKGINQVLQIWKKDDEGNWKAAVVVMYPEESE